MGKPRSRAPNIVLVVADYMGYGDIGPYGARDVRTPALDRLAREGARFTDFYSAAPICAPARAALLAGRYPERVGVARNPVGDEGLAPAHETIASRLAAAGYHTAIHGKWHLGSRADLRPAAHGFAEFLGFFPWTINYYTHRTLAGEPGLHDNEGPVTREGYLTDVLTEAALGLVGEEREAPFFLYLAYNTALPPYQPPGLAREAWEGGWDVNAASRADYVAMVESMDAGIGRVLDALDARGIADDTVVAFLYDHGGRHLVRSHPLFHGFGTLWEGGIRVPLLLRWPGRVPAGRVESRPSIAMDVSATLLAAGGALEGAPALDGVDLLPVLNGEDDGGERSFFWRTDYPNFLPQRAVRRGRFKHVVDGQTQFLFDLEADIGERENLLARYPGEAAALRTAHAEWAASMLGGRG